MIGDTGKTSGSEMLKVHNGSKTENLKIILVGSTGYIRGNDAALEKALGLTATQSTLHEQMAPFPTSNTSLAELVSGLRDSEVASELEMTGPYTFGATKRSTGISPKRSREQRQHRQGQRSRSFST